MPIELNFHPKILLTKHLWAIYFPILLSFIMFFPVIFCINKRCHVVFKCQDNNHTLLLSISLSVSFLPLLFINFFRQYLFHSIITGLMNHSYSTSKTQEDHRYTELQTELKQSLHLLVIGHTRMVIWLLLILILMKSI